MSRTKAEEKEFTLHPLGLVARHSVTYLLATVDDYEDIRHFALHRIKQCRESRDVYRVQKEFDIDEYLGQGAFGYRLGNEDIELVAKIGPEIAWLLSETPVSKEQSISLPDEDGKVILTAIVPNDLQTQWWIMAFGADIEVIEPIDWRNHIKKLIDKLSIIYK